MKKLIVYFAGKAHELAKLVDEAERDKTKFPQWLVDAQILELAAQRALKANAPHAKDH